VAGAFLAVSFFATLKICADHMESLTPIATFLGEKRQWVLATRNRVTRYRCLPCHVIQHPGCDNEDNATTWSTMRPLVHVGVLLPLLSRLADQHL
jgi:hypothetical protein